MKIIYFIIAFISISSYAQEISISGVVTNASDGLPIPGVNVIIKNSSNGTTTDFDGKFNLNNLNKGDLITFSYVGFKSQTKQVDESMSSLSIILEENLESLEQIVVIGYGTQRKKDVTGAVALVTGETIEQLKPIEASQALQGTVSGVNVTSPSGSPGADFNITIRGISSNTDNGPLVIIDGYQGNLNSLNPNDIESFSVLKDAQAAIYGIDGANGVILVTTKRGKKNKKATFDYNSYVGFQETSRKLPLLNATEYALLLNESYAANGDALPFSNISGLGQGTDWQEEVFDNSLILNHSLSISGGSENINYYLGGSFLEQEGIVAKEKSDFTRATVKMSLGVKLSDRLDFDGTVNYLSNRRKSISENGLGSILFNAINYAPTFELDQEDLDGFLGNEVINPLSQIENTYNQFRGSGIEGAGKFVYKLFPELKLTTRFGAKRFEGRNKTFAPIVDYGSGKVFNNPRSSVTQTSNLDQTYNFELFANFDKLINDAHQVSLTGGISAQRFWGEGLSATGFDVPNNSWEFADIALADGVIEAKTNSAFNYDSRRFSAFGRLQYDYEGKYLFSFLTRYDTTSNFSPDNRSDIFPSLTAGWNVSEEDFWDTEGFLNSLKIRGSYGFIGGEVGQDLYRTLLDGEATYVFDGSIISGVATGRIPNIFGQWETAEKFDIGADLKFLNGDLEIITDYFIEDREDLLILSLPTSGIVGGGAPGASNPTVNAGTSRNTGVEFSISYSKKINEDFSFGINYNFSRIENEVTEIEGDTFLEAGSFGVGQPAPSRMEVGQPIGYFYGLKTDGIFQNQQEIDAHPSQVALGNEAQPGDLRFVDTNGDNVIDLNDRTNIGNPLPEYYMGLNLNLNYKQFDIVAYAFANLGQERVRNYERDQPNVNRLSLYLDRWTGEGTSNSVPRVTTGTNTNRLFSDFFVEDASFLRIQNVQLGYSLPEDSLSKIGINKLRIYVSGVNLHTFTEYTGYDPAATTSDAIGGGVDFGFYPVPRQYLLGVNLNF